MNIYQNDKEICRLLLSPLTLTGDLKSLLITHNSWFINDVLPLIFNKKIDLKNKFPSPRILFENMDFKLWMDNGFAYPKSANQVEKIINSKSIQIN